MNRKEFSSFLVQAITEYTNTKYKTEKTNRVYRKWYQFWLPKAFDELVLKPVDVEITVNEAEEGVTKIGIKIDRQEQPIIYLKD